MLHLEHFVYTKIIKVVATIHVSRDLNAFAAEVPPQAPLGELTLLSLARFKGEALDGGEGRQGGEGRRKRKWDK